MFTSIDNERGISLVKDALNQRTVKKPSTECLLEALTLCLFNNNSKFEQTHLLQTNGTATGAPNSCSYADLAVAPIDESIFSANIKHLFYYGRYRDDCLTIWCGSLDELHNFFEFLNTLSDDLKFTMEIGNDSICFLDLQISIVNGKLETSVYSKPTDSHLYLHQLSCHKLSTIKGIRKGVALRLRRICSSDVEYETKSLEYIKYLVDRGHNADEVKKVFVDIGKIPRSEARKKKSNSVNRPKVILAASYNPRGPDVAAIVKKHLPLLKNDPVLNDLFPPGSILVASKRESNLKDLLMRADPYNVKADMADTGNNGLVKCNKTCDACKNFLVESGSVKCSATGRKFRIRKTLTCETANVIYVAHCSHCGKQGVGSTTSWKPRLRNYKSHINKGVKSCKIAGHFIDGCSNPSLSNLKFTLVDCLNNTDGKSSDEIDELLLSKEKFWIGTLITQHKGMNGTHDWNRKKRSDKEK